MSSLECKEENTLPQNNIKVCYLNYVAPQCRLIFSPSTQPAGVSTGPVRDCGKMEEKLLALAEIRSVYAFANSTSALPSHILDLSTVLLWI